ncbi:Uncharacterised protein at_DN0520, partial [Pycnogonum litorale]
MRHHFRDYKAWKDDGLQITNGSDEVCKLYDAAVSNVFSWGYESSYGDVVSIGQKIKAASDNCVLPQIMLNSLELLGGKTAIESEEVKKNIDHVLALSKKQEDKLTEREKLHASALRYLSVGKWRDAVLDWDKILVDHPTDAHAFHSSIFTLFYMGDSHQMMRQCSRIASFWNKDIPLHDYFFGYYAFSLEEGGLYAKAEDIASKHLETSKHDVFANHAMAHVFEMTGRLEEGANFMERRRPYWQDGMNTIECHNLWHNILFHFERKDFETTLDMYDSKLKNYLTENNFLAFTDATSLLYRLQMAGVAVGKDRWREIAAVAEKYENQSRRPFYSSHILMAYLGAEDKDKTNKLLDECRELLTIDVGDISENMKEVGISLLEAMKKFDEQLYDEACDILRRIKPYIYKIGGSHAQRDVFQQLACYAALRSSRADNQNFAR